MLHFPHIKMKNKLIMIILLPVLILLFFIGILLWQEYRTIKNMRTIQYLTPVIKEISLLIDSLNYERGLLIISLHNKEEIFAKQYLLDARKKTDTSIHTFNTLTENLLNDEFFKKTLQQNSDNLEKVKRIREMADAGRIPEEEMLSEYEQIALNLEEMISEISHLITNFEIIQKMFSYMLILQEKIYGGHERAILAGYLYDKEIPSEIIEIIERTIAMQEAIKISFFEISSHQDVEFYNNTMKGSLIEETQKMRSIILNSQTSGKTDINPLYWWETETGRIHLLTIVDNYLLERINEISQNSINLGIKKLVITISSILFLLTITLIFIFYYLRVLTGGLEEEINVLTYSSEEIMSSIEEASKGTSEIATAMVETSTTAEELKQTVQISSDKAKNVSEISDNTLSILKKGEDLLGNTIEWMNHTHKTMGSISDCIIKLINQSRSIALIIDSVNNLSDQSHLLAVNATIAAAKAKEQEREFSVVAKEVRSLAKQSKDATNEVKTILSDIQKSTKAVEGAAQEGIKAVLQGVNLAEQINESIKSISGEISKVAQAATQISISEQQQLSGIKQVTSAMISINHATSLQVSHMQLVEKKVQDLGMLGHRLKTLTSEYKV